VKVDYSVAEKKNACELPLDSFLSVMAVQWKSTW